MDIDKKSLSKYGIEITDYNITASDNEGYGSNFDIEMCLQCGLIEGQSKLTDSITLVSVFYNKDGELVTSQELFFVSRVQGATHGNVLLRKAQYALSDDEEWSLHVAQLMIAAKIQNYRNVLRRYIRDYGECLEVEEAVKMLDANKRDVLDAEDKTKLMGFEGIASNAYFEVLPNLILNQKESFPFNGRNRRPPKDAVNAMLSLAYTLIANDCTAALETVGLDPYVGFLHALRPGRTSLALDMMEEFRAYLGDRFVLSLINKRQITPKDFLYQGDNGVVMTDNGRKTFITAWQNRKRETLIHPYLNEKVEIGLLPYVQAMMLARYVRKDIDNYPVFLIK